MTELCLRRKLAHVRRALRVVVAASVLPACASNEPHESPGPRYIVADVIVSVDNRTSRPMFIYVEAGAMQHVLGEIPKEASRSFSLPSGAGDSTSALQLEAREHRTTPGVRSDTFHVTSGQRVSWTLARDGSSAVTTR